jgi:hypothetical protein
MSRLFLSFIENSSYDVRSHERDEEICDSDACGLAHVGMHAEERQHEERDKPARN